MVTTRLSRQTKLGGGTLLIIALSLVLSGTVKATPQPKPWELIRWDKPKPIVERLSADKYILPEGWKEAVKGVHELVVYNAGGLSGDIATKINMTIFEQLTGIKVKAVAVSPRVLRAKVFSTVIAKDSSVHILIADNSMKDLSYLVAGGWATPVDVLYPPEVLQLYSPVIRLLNYEGHWWASPLLVFAPTEFYRPSWLKNAGVDVPTTWEELYEAAKKCRTWARQNLGEDYYGVTFSADVLGFSQLYMVSIWCQGGKMLYGKGRFDLSGPEAKNALGYWANLIREDIASRDNLSYGTYACARAFGMGKAAFTNATLSYAMKFMTEFPEIANDWAALGPLKWNKSTPEKYRRTIVPLTGGVVNVYADDKHKAAAMLYLDLIRSKEATRNELVVEGNETFYSAQYEDPNITEKVDWALADRCADKLGIPHPSHIESLIIPKVRQSVVRSAWYVMYPPGIENILIEVVDQLGKIVLGKVSIEEAHKNLQKVADEVSP